MTGLSRPFIDIRFYNRRDILKKKKYKFLNSICELCVVTREMRKENITPSDMLREQNLFLAWNLFISRSMAARFPHGALKLQPRDEKDINHWSVKIEFPNLKIDLVPLL